MKPTLRAPAGIPLPHLEIVLGGIGWVVGSMGLGSGGDTVVLAFGLAAAIALWITIRRRQGLGARLDRGTRSAVLQTGFVAVALIVGFGLLLPMIGTGWGELTVPLACAIAGLALFPLAARLAERSLVAVGGVLVVLGAVGAFLALDSPGAALSQGVVGFGAALVAWLAGALRTGLLTELRQRVVR